MKKYSLLLIVFLVQNINVFSQTKVLSKSTKKNIVLKSSDSLIKVKGKGKTVTLASDNALWFLNNEAIKRVNFLLDTNELIDDSEKDLFLIKKRFQYKSTIDSLLSIENTFDFFNKENIKCIYWEELRNKKRGNIYYQYYIAYDLLESKLDTIYNQYVFVSTSLNDLYNRVVDVNIQELSIENLVLYQDTISKLSNLFISEHRISTLEKVNFSIEQYLKSFSIRISQHEKGVFFYEIYNISTNKVFLLKKSAKIISNCVQINNILTSSKSNTVYYNNSRCEGEKQLIKITIPLTNTIELTKVVNVNPKTTNTKIALLSDLQIVWKKKYYLGYIKIKLNSEVNVELSSKIKLDVYGDKIEGKLIKSNDLISNTEYLIEFSLPNYKFLSNAYIWELSLITKDKLNDIEKQHDFYKVNYFQ